MSEPTGAVMPPCEARDVLTGDLWCPMPAKPRQYELDGEPIERWLCDGHAIVLVLDGDDRP